MQLSYSEIETPQLFKANIRINKLGKNEHIPLMPGLLEHLMSMSGSMKPAVDYSNCPQNTSKKYQIKRMLDSGMTGREIVHEIGIPKSTVYRHIKAIRAGA
jgi:hypothetical protein